MRTKAISAPAREIKDLVEANFSDQEIADFYGYAKKSLIARRINLGVYRMEKKVKEIEKTHRLCLKCKKLFYSKGKGNRLCYPCSRARY